MKGHPRIVHALLGAVLGLTGCGDAPRTLDWDLSDTHTRADVDWAGEAERTRDLDVLVIEPIAEIRIDLPGGTEFTAGDEVHDVTVQRDGDTVTTVSIDYRPETADDALARARRLMAAWNLVSDDLDTWYAEVGGAGRAGAPGSRATTRPSAVAEGGALAAGGPSPRLEIRYAFDDALPWLVSFHLDWTAPGS